MNSRLSKITKVETETFSLPFISKNMRGFSSKANPVKIIQWINYKLKTGFQWYCLFADIEVFKPTYS
jgi:hypothetical protein